MIKTVFFDFDGVIAESLNAKTEAFYHMYLPYGSDIAEKVKIHHLEHGGVSRFEKFKIYHRDYLGIDLTPEQVQELAGQFSALVLDKVVHAPYVPGALESIRQLYSDGYQLIVISGTPDDEMKEICHRREISHYFTDICGSPADKKEWCRVLMEKYRLDPGHIVFIGDATTDRDAAAAYHIHFILREHPDNSVIFAGYSGTRVPDLQHLPDTIKNIV